MPPKPTNSKKRAEKILSILDGLAPKTEPSLNFSNPFELLVATVLSAQATDKLVNKVTPALFRKYKNAKELAGARIEELEKCLASVNFYRNKARNLKNCSIRLVEDFNGRVPDNLKDLTALPGVGRKTANIVLGNAFGKEALAVDTHVGRVARRLGLTKATNPDLVEADLTSIIAQKLWTKTTHLFIFHGRSTCKARRPLCAECAISELCEYYAGNGKD